MDDNPGKCNLLLFLSEMLYKLSTYDRAKHSENFIFIFPEMHQFSADYPYSALRRFLLYSRNRRRLEIVGISLVPLGIGQVMTKH